MYRTKIIFCAILFLSFSLLAQDGKDIELQLENKIYSERPEVLVYLIDANEVKLPTVWIDIINKGLSKGITSTDRFGKEIFFDPKNQSAAEAWNHPTPYVAKFEMIDILVDGRRITSELPSTKKEYTITGNFILLDLVTGTRLISEIIIFAGLANDLTDEIFLDKMSNYIENQIKAKLLVTFPIIIEVAKLGEVNKEKAKTIFLKKYDYVVSGKPKYLGVYILEKSLTIDDNEPIHIFKKIGYLKDLKKIKGYECEYQVEKGKSEIYEYFNAETKLYVTSLTLGK